MDFVNGVISGVYEADVDDGLYIGEFEAELGIDVVNAIIPYFIGEATDFGGGVKDVPLSVIVNKFGDSHVKLASALKISRAKAKSVIEICQLYGKSVIAYG